jgi:uncharacterized SAM-binding protein YcdF (DUF218 family)
MFFLTISLIIMLIGLIRLKINKRSIIGGIFLASGLILSLSALFFELLTLIYLYFPSGNFTTLIIAYGIVPLIFLLICGYFILNSQTMKTKEGKSATAKLSALFGLNLLIAFPTLFVLLTISTVRIPQIIWYGLLYFLLIDIILCFLFAAYILYSWMSQMIPLQKKIDYIIILGSGIRSEEVPPLLKSRLDKGIEYYHKNPRAKFVVSGGQGPDEPVSEAFAMRKYLQSQHIPDERILFEDQSTTTYENMFFSKKIIDDDWSDVNSAPSIIFSTNNYHVLRGSLYAQRVKLKAEGVGAPTALYFLPTALIREYIALLLHRKIILFSVLGGVLLLIIISLLPF